MNKQNVTIIVLVVLLLSLIGFAFFGYSRFDSKIEKLEEEKELLLTVNDSLLVSYRTLSIENRRLDSLRGIEVIKYVYINKKKNENKKKIESNTNNVLKLNEHQLNRTIRQHKHKPAYRD